MEFNYFIVEIMHKLIFLPQGAGQVEGPTMSSVARTMAHEWLMLPLPGWCCSGALLELRLPFEGFSMEADFPFCCCGKEVPRQLVVTSTLQRLTFELPSLSVGCCLSKRALQLYASVACYGTVVT